MHRRRSRLVLGFLLGGVLATCVLLMAGSRAVAADPTAVTLGVEERSDGTVLLTATVTGEQRLPVADVLVTFQVKTTFGWLAVADVATDRSGRARVVLPTMPRSGEITAEAETGSTTLHAATRITRVPPPPPQTRPGYDRLTELSLQPGFISPYPVPLEVIVLGTVLGGIWITYGFLVSMLGKIRRAPDESRVRGSQWR